MPGLGIALVPGSAPAFAFAAEARRRASYASLGVAAVLSESLPLRSVRLNSASLARDAAPQRHHVQGGVERVRHRGDAVVLEREFGGRGGGEECGGSGTAARTVAPITSPTRRLSVAPGSTGRRRGS